MTTEEEQMGPSRTADSSSVPSGRQWWQLRQRWRMLGLFEINQDHEFYQLTAMMKEGLQAVQTGMEAPEQESLTAEHLKAEEIKTYEGFEMQTFAAPVFAHLRRSLNITEEEYQNSLCSGGCYLQFVSNSKSKANFFVTNDKRFFLKTQNKREVHFLLSNLQAYSDHLEKYPHSLIVRFLGLHRIGIPNQKTKYFIVMQSVFFPDERINIRYDIKGCEVGRWTNPDTGGKQIIKVLKDNNFEEQLITLAQEKSWFENQVKKDAAFLRELNVLDYSLLLAHQPLHRDELEGKHSLADLVIRTTMSMDFDDSPTGSDPAAAPILDKTAGRAAPAPAAKESWSNAELQEFQERHCRLLPNCKNAVHVIDGPDRRYFVGIIDIFTVYGLKKKLEKQWKKMRFPGRAFSTISPVKYSHRFCQWIQDHTQ